MRLTLRPSMVCICLALVAGCGDESAGSGLDKLKSAGEKTASQAKEAGGKVAEQAKDAGAAMNAQLAEAGAWLKELTSDAASGMSMKGDELGKKLNAKLPELNKLVDTVKSQLTLRGGELKDMAAGLTTKQDGFTKSLDALTKAGAEAGKELKQSTLDALSSLTTSLDNAMAKLKG